MVMIGDALENSRFFFLLSTKDSMESDYVKLEYETFHSQFYMKNQDERKFIILKGSDFSINNVPYIYRILQFANNPKEILDTLIQNESFINENSENSENNENNTSDCMNNYMPKFESVSNVCDSVGTFKDAFDTQGLNNLNGFEKQVGYQV